MEPKLDLFGILVVMTWLYKNDPDAFIKFAKPVIEAMSEPVPYVIPKECCIDRRDAYERA